MRLEKLTNAGLPRDRENQAILKPHLTRFVEFAAENEQRVFHDAELAQYRWMLEEFRVSLFAQQLGISQSVSPQRLDKQWAKIRL